MLGYTVYRTTNRLNGMFYIGVHKTANPEDNYLGSGKRLKYAIKKYGVENFKKEILFVFETAEEAYFKEKELVTEEVLDSGKCYNLKLGGEGGWDFSNKNYDKEKRRISSKATIPKMNEAYKLKCLDDPEFMKKLSKRVSLQNLETAKNRNHPFQSLSPEKRFSSKGTKRTDEQKNKMRLSSLGSKNSQFGSKWITDGILNKKIKKDQEIPERWRSGRVIKTSGETHEKC